MDGPLERHVALVGFMGAGKSTTGAEVAGRIGRPFVDLDRELETATGTSIAGLFAERGELAFRVAEAKATVEALRKRPPAVLALGGGAASSEEVQLALRGHATTVLLDVGVDEAWRRAQGTDRPLARDELRFRALFRKREPLYQEVADAVAASADDAVLAAGRVTVQIGSLELLGDLVPGRGGVALVADAHVAGIYGPTAQLALGPRLVSTHELPPGEGAKSLGVLERLWQDLRLDRTGALAALGGGCTTDAAGFAAAAYLRGVAWTSVPTTLVGQVDAGIGGKTAVDLPGGKNLVGAFHWPSATVIDPAALATLPEAERRSGMAEAVKTGLLAGDAVWELDLAELVRRCALYKTAVCLRDPYETGERTVLNLGHTFAHALEAASHYALRHGDAVALGLAAALRLSGLDSERKLVEELLAPRPVRVDRELAWRALQRDKKAVDGRIRLVLLDGPGRPRVASDVAPAEVRRALDELIDD